MLILTRYVGETVLVDDHIQVTVLGVDRGQIRLGFEAPQSVKILRKEISERIKKEQEDAKS